MAFDIDDTIADIHDVVMRRVNRKLKGNYTFLETVTQLEQNGPLWKAYIREYEDLWTKKHKTIRLFLDKRLMKRVSKYYDIGFVSARGFNLKTTKGLKSWLRYHRLDHIKLDVTHTSDAKAELKYDIFVDDYPLKVKGKRMLLLIHREHNKAFVLPKNAMRFDNVNQAIHFLIKRATNEVNIK